ncbi:ABC transporter permease [Nocardia sp. BMG111209]|uniref:ABC transporter permease n=1 Tax=Nocardia sp. BMG111209 TaxID=1160137 RepID=UPI0003627E69|nr:ABC transporter permease [Nocardia sp. BMG111209]
MSSETADETRTTAGETGTAPGAATAAESGQRAEIGSAAIESEPPAPRSRRWNPAAILAPTVVFALVVGLWYFASYEILAPSRRFLLPPPQDVLTKGLLGPSGPDMWQALERTTVVALTGLAIAVVLGIAWAILMSQAGWAERALFPYAVVMQCVPILALVPLIGFWFGFGFVARVFVCVLIALFPVVSNTLFGLKSVDQGLRDLFALRGTGRLTVLRKLEFPAALPAIFAGVRISAGLSVVGAIVGDFFFKQGDPGIGILIDNYRSRLQSPQLFAAILLASALGVVVFGLFGWVSRRVVGNWYDSARR